MFLHDLSGKQKKIEKIIDPKRLASIIDLSTERSDANRENPVTHRVDRSRPSIGEETPPPMSVVPRKTLRGGKTPAAWPYGVAFKQRRGTVSRRRLDRLFSDRR